MRYIRQQTAATLKRDLSGESTIILTPPTLLLAVLAVQTQLAPSVVATHTDTPPEVDGVLDEEVWGRATPLTRFVQFEPRRGEPASQPTEVRILFDETAVYFGFRVTEPASPTAELTRRDADLLTDDAVIVVLDTYGDRQSGYFFGVNPLGTQADGRIASDGREVDPTWDGEWSAATTRTDDDWSVEISIPLSSLRYSAGENKIWGLNVGRSRRSNLELSFWSGPLENAFRVSGAGRLVGLDLPPPARRYQAIPYGLSQFEQDASTEWEAGVDLQYRITPAITADATLNPDFAIIEADQEQVNLTRFELSLPEKRPFFLEGSELFRQRIRTFYSRRIADIRAGGKLSGKVGPWTMSFMGVGTELTDTDPGAFFGVTRIQRDLGRSSIGAMWAGRHADGDGRGSVSMDATLFFSPRFGMTAQMVESYGDFSSGSHAFFVRPSYDSPTGHFHVRYTDLGDRFADNANAVGFIRDDDRRELDSAIEKIHWFGPGAFERFRYDSNYNVYWGQT